MTGTARPLRRLMLLTRHERRLIAAALAEVALARAGLWLGRTAALRRRAARLAAPANVPGNAPHNAPGTGALHIPAPEAAFPAAGSRADEAKAPAPAVPPAAAFSTEEGASPSRSDAPLPAAALAEVAWSVAAAARAVPGASCLTQALAGQALLARRGIASTVEVSLPAGGAGFRPHAWLIAGGRVLLGGTAAEHARHHRLTAFAVGHGAGGATR